MWRVTVPWGRQGSGGRAIPEQLHLLPFTGLQQHSRHGTARQKHSTGLPALLWGQHSQPGTVPFPQPCREGRDPPPSQSTQQWDGMAVGWKAVGWMAAGQAPLRVTKAGSEPGILFGESSHPRDTQQDTQPAQPTERPTGPHLTLDFQPGLNSLPGRAATLSQEKETDGSGCVKAMALFPLREGKTQVLLPAPLYGPGGSIPHPSQQCHSSCPAPPARPRTLPEAAALGQGSAPAPLVAWLVSLTKP